MGSIFSNGAVPIKTKEQKKLSSLAKKPHKRLREVRRPGPVKIVYQRHDENIDLSNNNILPEDNI